MKAEVLVVGGGLAGCAAAIGLARGGRDVMLAEREAGAANKVCGEFLSAEALGYLRELGVKMEALGAVPITAMRLDGVEAKLPFTAMSLTRRRLDEELLRVSVEAGVRVVRGCLVEGMEAVGEAGRCSSLSAPVRSGRDDKGLERVRETGGWMVRSRGEVNDIAAGAVFLATGKHDLRGWGRPPGRQDGLVAFKMYWRLSAAQKAALDGFVELVLFPGGYGGMQVVEDGTANFSCLIERRELRRMGGRWDELLAAMLAGSAHLRGRLEGAEPLLEKPMAVSAIPYGMVRDPVKGVWCLGDQAAVIPSFTGDGMSIALHSGVLAARMFLEGATPEAFQSRLKTELRWQVRLATWISQGLVTRPGMLLAAAKVWPGALKVVAAGTRISGKAMR